MKVQRFRGRGGFNFWSHIVLIGEFALKYIHLNYDNINNNNNHLHPATREHRTESVSKFLPGVPLRPGELYRPEFVVRSLELRRHLTVHEMVEVFHHHLNSNGNQ